MPYRPTATSPRLPGADGWSTTPLQQVRSLYNAFVKGLFATAPPGNYRWSQGEESELYVSDESPIKASSAGARPAISFTRGAVQFSSLGIDDMMSYSFETGQKKKGVLIPGIMSINCCSRVDIESERLAFIVAEHLWLLREYLMKLGFFEIGRQPNISATSQAGSLVANEGGDEWYCTTVLSPFQFSRTSQVTPLNLQIVQNIALRLTAQKQPTGAGGWPASNGHEYPVSVEGYPPEWFAPDATDAMGGTPEPGKEPTEPIPKIYHPLNPSVEIRVRSINPYRPGIQPPSIGGRPIPLAESSVEESSANRVVMRVKI